jgi:hypothetical protein
VMGTSSSDVSGAMNPATITRGSNAMPSSDVILYVLISLFSLFALDIYRFM